MTGLQPCPICGDPALYHGPVWHSGPVRVACIHDCDGATTDR